MASTTKSHNREREQVKAAYPNPKWAQKVNDMSDNQVIAVYKRLRIQGKI